MNTRAEADHIKPQDDGGYGIMNRAWIVIVAIMIAVHGLVHLMGTAAYLKLYEVQGLPYKTTIFGGVWDLGSVGIMAFRVLWAFAAVVSFRAPLG